MSERSVLVISLLILIAILQTSFAPHLAVFDGEWFEWINFVTVTTTAIALFERRRHNLSWLAAAISGIYLDIYSQRFFGFWIITLLAMVAIIKFAVKKYVRIPSFW